MRKIFIFVYLLQEIRASNCLIWKLQIQICSLGATGIYIFI